MDQKSWVWYYEGKHLIDSTRSRDQSNQSWESNRFREVESIRRIDSTLIFESILIVESIPDSNKFSDSTSQNWFDFQDWFDWSIDLVESFECLHSYFLTQNFWSTAGLSIQIYVEVLRYVNLSRWRKIIWPTLQSDSLCSDSALRRNLTVHKIFLMHLGIYFLLAPTLIVLGRII